MNKFKELRKSKKITQNQLSKDLGVNQATISKWESDVSFPDYSTLIKIAKYYKVSIDYLLNDNNNENQHQGGIKIPVLGVIPAGIPIEAIEDIIDYEDISYALSKTGNFFALKVKGDSMSPQIEEDDILIIKQQEDAQSGEVCVIMLGNDATVKRIKKDVNGIWLIPNNPSHQPMFFNNSEISSLPLKILGKAVEARRHL
ncbi:MAG: helix-turn-helix domain-containing protein [Clostridia bacterium]|nr:helix-turn-helix domain-containing protein [Clostridia bacterium]